MARLLIKFPTRSRPENFKKRLLALESHRSGEHEVRYVVSCDVTDLSMNNRRMRAWLRDFRREADLVFHYGWAFTKIQAVNANLRGEEADVLLVTSDDMKPARDGFDRVVFERFREYFPDFRGAIRFHDGARDDNLMTYPVIGWPLYQAFGYVYHPGYWSVYADNEQTEACDRLGRIHYDDTCLLHHEWVGDRPDWLHRRNDHRWMYRHDGRLYERRKKAGFDLDRVEERLADG